MRQKYFLFMLCGTLLLLDASPALASNKKDPNREAARRMQLEIQQVTNAKNALEQEKASINQELDALKKKYGRMEAAATRATHAKAETEKRVDALNQEKSAQIEKIAGLEKALNEARQQLKETGLKLQQETSQKQQLGQNLDARDKQVQVCEAKNQKLYRYHVELINRAQQRGSLGALLESEPVLGFKRVEIENLLEEYRDKIDAQKINSVAGVTATSAK